MTTTFPWRAKTIHHETCICTLCLIDLELKDEKAEDKFSTFIGSNGKPHFKCSKCVHIGEIHKTMMKHYELFHEHKI